MSKKSYQTVGKQALIGFFKTHPDCQFTADELYQQISVESPCAKSSLYRRLNELCHGEIIRKFYSADTARSVYQYVGDHCDCDSHFHEKCLSCGKIVHLECDASATFAMHLLQEHGFELNCGESIWYGYCEHCRKKGAAHA